MRTLRNGLVALAGVGILAVIGTLGNSHQPFARAAGGPTVTIDPTQLPLPVAGSATVSGQ